MGYTTIRPSSLRRPINSNNNVSNLEGERIIIFRKAEVGQKTSGGALKCLFGFLILLSRRQKRQKRHFKAILVRSFIAIKIRTYTNLRVDAQSHYFTC